MSHLSEEQRSTIDKIELLVRNKFISEGSGHDWWHIYRVREVAVKIALEEKADLFLTETAALLHDIADHKFHGGDIEAGPKEAARILIDFGLPDSVINKVCSIVKEVTFKGEGVPTPCSSKEAACVQDADRLDAIGAIGIARAFAYGGSKGRLLYDPEQKPQFFSDFNAYKSTVAPTINHFYEKLLLLKNRMNTNTAKVMAEQRHTFMEAYLEQFYDEWNASK